MDEPRARDEPVILVTDDEPAIRRLVNEVLCRNGYRAVEAVAGKPALARLREEKVAMLVTDLVMPDVDGIEVLQEARARFPGLKIIVMSGYPHYLESALLLGADGVLKKPFLPRELLDLVTKLLSEPQAKRMPLAERLART